MLDSYLPRPGQPDLRGWEWYYLLSQCHGELLTFRGHEGWVIAVAWSLDGRQIASSADQTIKIWDPASGKEVRNAARLQRHRSLVGLERGWRPTGLAGGDSIKVWSVSTGQELRHAGRPQQSNHVRGMESGSGRFAAGSNDGRIRILHAGTGEEIRVLNVHKHTANQESVPLSWSPDGRQLASASDRAVKIWDVSTGEELRTLRGHKDGISNVVWSPNGRRLAAGSWGIFEVKVWDATTGHELVSLKGLDSTVYGLAWSLDGRLLALGGYSGTVKISDAASGELVGTLRGHTLTAQAVAWSPNGTCVASGVPTERCRDMDATAEPEAPALRGQVRSVLAVAWELPDGRQLLGGGGRGRASRSGTSARDSLPDLARRQRALFRRWLGVPTGMHRLGQRRREDQGLERGHGTRVLHARRPPGSAGALVWSPDGRWLASGGDDATIRIWDVAAAKRDPLPRGQLRSGSRAGLEPRRRADCFGGRLGMARACQDLGGGLRPKRSRPPARGRRGPRSRPVAWSPDGRWVASAGRVIEVGTRLTGNWPFDSTVTTGPSTHWPGIPREIALPRRRKNTPSRSGTLTPGRR